MRCFATKLTLVAALLLGLSARCSGQVTLSWVLPSGTGIAGYYVCWGVSSGVYTETNTVLPNVSTITIQNPGPNEFYYFAVQSFSSNGAVSQFSNEAVYTNSESSTNSLTGPPSPGSTNGSGPGSTNGGGSGGISGGGSGTGGSGGSSGTGTSSTNVTQALFWGVPPFLTMTVSNRQPTINIGGTVGANLMIQATTDLFSSDYWTTVTNVSISNVATMEETNAPGQTQDALDIAYVPGIETISAPPSTGSSLQIFRAVMPYDYMILADMVLPAKGYTPRLIVVNMPGIVCDDVCYVNESASFIHMNRTNDALQLEASGSTIRLIASTLAGSLNLDWTSASEFTYSNGLGQILATVIETDPPSSDPVAGQNPASPPIVINF